LLAPHPTPIPEDQASVFISPRGRVATHFSRLLRNAWVTVGLILFPGHHTGTYSHLRLHFSSSPFPSDIPTKSLYSLRTAPCVPGAPPTPCSSIWSPQ
jgi:hypothetical protein